MPPRLYKRPTILGIAQLYNLCVWIQVLTFSSSPLMQYGDAGPPDTTLLFLSILPNMLRMLQRGIKIPVCTISLLPVFVCAMLIYRRLQLRQVFQAKGEYYRSPITLYNITPVSPNVLRMRLLRGLPLTISRVQTLRIQTFNFPSTPSTFSNSTPSHQHRRAGFRQNKSSFCAMPTAFEFAASPRMSVRRRARAIEQTTALLGSAARWPHISAASKPLDASQCKVKTAKADVINDYPAVSISIRCCSVVPGSSLFRRPEKIPSCFNNALPAARLTSVISSRSISFRGGMA